MVRKIEAQLQTDYADDSTSCQQLGDNLENQVEQQDIYRIDTEVKSPTMAVIYVTNPTGVDELGNPTKLSARFFIQNITQIDTYFSIRHWYGMQKAMVTYGGPLD